ncbi:MAG TPA: DUF2071 domain-containing protein [Propionibacteriaceae bacterium]|nr:DUF2071 domain-containing protein [Propionibacteriaceae bacterium]
MTSPSPPWPVRWPVMYQTWSWLSFLHWPYDPAVVQRLLPNSLEVQTFQGQGWVGVTPFFLEDLRTPVAPALPWFTSFPETNVRTYVVGPDGREGLWFFSLDAARLEPVLVARSTYALPYMWSAMAVERDGPVIRYRSRRSWPGPTPATSRITVEIGDRLRSEELDEFDHYLTARWQLYTTLGPVLARSTVEHEPWPLYRAVVRELDTDLVAAAGLPAPEGDPVVHWSPGVRTRISGFRPIGRP